MTYSRRELCLMMTALAAAAKGADQNVVLPSKVYRYAEMPARESNGNTMHSICEGSLHDGFHLEVHETRLAPGNMPHPAHHHAHEEMFLLREGTLEVTINGQSIRMGPGSVGFVASNQEHGVRNVGTTPAEYFVVEMGKD